MSRIDTHRQALRSIDDWEPHLLAESGLPGPHGNIELAQAVADEGDEPLFLHLLSFDAASAPTNTPQEFLAFCGVVGLGRLVAEGRPDLLPALRRHANDPRWRMREGVAMALQRWGRVDMPGLLSEMDDWSHGSLLEQRAAAAALCEPALLGDPTDAERTLYILDAITLSVKQSEDRRSDAFQALRKGLAYCWSVAVAALDHAPEPAKQRLVRIDAGWVATSLARLDT